MPKVEIIPIERGDGIEFQVRNPQDFRFAGEQLRAAQVACEGGSWRFTVWTEGSRYDGEGHSLHSLAVEEVRRRLEDHSGPEA